jgi:hypothetical protein
MVKSKYLLTQYEAQRIEWGEPIGKVYSYIPVIYYPDTWNSSKGEYHEDIWHSLRYNDKPAPQSLLSYVSKVPLGQTLWQAVRHDLEADFNLPHEKSFTIESAKPYDTAKDTDGNMLSRLLVWVDVRERLAIADTESLGTVVHWHDEGEDAFNPIWEYFK